MDRNTTHTWVGTIQHMKRDAGIAGPGAFASVLWTTGIGRPLPGTVLKTKHLTQQALPENAQVPRIWFLFARNVAAAELKSAKSLANLTAQANCVALPAQKRKVLVTVVYLRGGRRPNAIKQLARPIPAASFRRTVRPCKHFVP